jgi:anthranilate synthase component 2
MKILVIDNYDSFTYNLVHYLDNLKKDNDTIDVYRNDKINLESIKQYDKLLISPGPGIPDEAGISKSLINEYAATKSILGVCLGHQSIGEVFGASLLNMDKVYHGIGTPIKLIKTDDPLFKNIPAEFEGGRYHSWIIDNAGFPDSLEITAVDNHNRIMGIRHKEYDVRGVQFHPESVLTKPGIDIMKNWLTNL